MAQSPQLRWMQNLNVSKQNMMRIRSDDMAKHKRVLFFFSFSCKLKQFLCLKNSCLFKNWSHWLLSPSEIKQQSESEIINRPSRQFNFWCKLKLLPFQNISQWLLPPSETAWAAYKGTIWQSSSQFLCNIFHFQKLASKNIN